MSSLSQNIKDEFDHTIYETTKDLLQPTYGDKVDCMMKYLKDKNIIDNIYTSELLFDNEQLEKRLKPFLPDALKNCSTTSDVPEPFLKTPSGIGLIIGIVILLSAIVGGLLYWRSSTKKRNLQRVSTDDRA